MEIAENNCIEMTIEKPKEFLPKVTGGMSKDQQSENVQQFLKSILYCQDLKSRIAHYN